MSYLLKVVTSNLQRLNSLCEFPLRVEQVLNDELSYFKKLGHSWWKSCLGCLILGKLGFQITKCNAWQNVLESMALGNPSFNNFQHVNAR